jgi:hypothetical protein
MPRTRHCVQNLQTSTTKPLMQPKPTNDQALIEPTETTMIEEFLSATEARQAVALQEFAAKVRTMVERGLIAARGKALREIRTIDVGFFLQAPLGTLHGPEQHTLEAKSEAL